MKIVLSIKLIFYVPSWTLTTSRYPTEPCQSILQPEISIHFAHFWFRRENLSFNDTTTRMEFVVSVTVCSVRHIYCCSGLISFVFIGSS